MITKVCRPVLLAVLLSMVALPAVADMPTTTRVSLSEGGGQRERDSRSAAISASGRFVVFFNAVDIAGNVITEGPVYLRDRRAGTIRRIDLDQTGRPQPGANNYWAAVSANARFIALATTARLVRADTNQANDVFVLDRARDRWQRVSVSSRETQGNRNSGAPTGETSPTIAASGAKAISADGRFVVFMSLATNLVSGDTNRAADIFIRDRRAGTTRRMSTGRGGAQPAISANGRFVAFRAPPAAGGCGPGGGCADIVIRNQATGARTVITRSPTGAPPNGDSRLPAVSGAGAVVAFTSDASNLVAGDDNEVADVFVWSRRTGQIRRVSLSSAGVQADSPSFETTVTADGRFVAFTSWATNLVPGDTNGTPARTGSDIFLHDRQAGTTSRLSVSSTGAEANGDSFLAVLSGDGRFVAFTTDATMQADDTNFLKDVYLRGPLLR